VPPKSSCSQEEAFFKTKRGKTRYYLAFKIKRKEGRGGQEREH
jgi:hypothetical protein